MSHRQSARVAILLGIVLATTLWAGRSESAERRSPSKQPVVTLNMWIMQNSQHKSAGSFSVFIRAFTQENPYVKVAVTLIPWAGAWDKIQGAIHGGPSPDIVQLGTTWVSTIAATGKLLNITGEYDEKIFPTQVLATTTIEARPGAKARRFVMPWIVDTRALYYNKAACALAGVDPKTDFATWASFKAALKKLKDVEVDGKRMQPFVVPRNNWDVVHTLSWWIWGFGGGFISRTPEESGINSPGSLAGIEYAIGLVREGLMMHSPEDGNMRAIANMLEKGEVATAIGYPVAMLGGERFGVTILPAGPKGRFTFLGGSALAILKSSMHPKESLALIKFLSDEAVQFSYSNLTGLLPAAAAEYDELALKLDPVRRVFVEQMHYGKSYPAIPQWGPIENLLRDGFNSLWDMVLQPGPYDPAAVRSRLDELAKQIDHILAGN